MLSQRDEFELPSLDWAGNSQWEDLSVALGWSPAFVSTCQQNRCSLLNKEDKSTSCDVLGLKRYLEARVPASEPLPLLGRDDFYRMFRRAPI